MKQQFEQSHSKELMKNLYSLKNIVFSIFLLIVLIPSLRAQDSSGPVLSGFSQSTNSVDITSGELP